ncbi:hypothetical protein [Streptosporangium sp. KLBMP 9127]|nr:hypothetical protein [Streptosporangium sp. KLBMP 9127]
MDQAAEIARAVLYEGYLLWPYRQSAPKNRHRWTIGGVHPEPYGRAHDGNPWLMQTQVLLQAGPADTVEARVRFLHVVTHEFAGPPGTTGGEAPVREEATERETAVTGLGLAELLGGPARVEIDIPAGEDVEWLTDAGGRRVAAALRRWEAVRGHVEVHADLLRPGLCRLTVRVANTTGWHGASRAEALKRTLVSAHTVVSTGGGRFVSLMDPPEDLRAFADGCRNLGTWPVLVGGEDERHTMLSSPIILYDHPRISPESPGDLFDATEIDQLLTLSVLALTEEEQREIREGDPRGRAILDRCAALSPEQLMRLHGTMREVRREPGT